MATVDECNHSVLDMVTKMSTMLVAYEMKPNKPTAVLVAKRRSKIYESLLHSKTMSSEDKLKMLHQVSSEVAKNPDRMDVLLSFESLLEGQDKEKSKITEDQDAENHSKVLIKRLKPGPLQLIETIEIVEKPLHPKAFPDINQMNRALKPMQLQPYSNIRLPSNLNRKPPPEKLIPNITPSTVLREGLAESIARMRNESEKPMHPPPTLPVLTKKVAAKLEDERPFVAQPGPQKHLASDIFVTNELKIFQNKNLVLNYLNEATLIDHLKKASCGIESLTFPSSSADTLELRVRPNTTLPTVLPEVLSDFANPFLRAGCAFLRLNARTKWNKITEMRLERPLTRAMRETIMDYLSTTRHFLLSLQADSLFQLLNNSSTAMQLLCQLDRMFENEPRLNLNTGITGSFLLSSIWLAIDTCENKDFLQLLIYFLRCISRNYFIQLQRWIYHGELDEPVNEIFISRSLNTSPSFTNECSKEFFDKSYQVVNEAIPEFLVGCEEQILQCGKYNLILQAYNARHPVFEVLYPDIEVCLTEQQLKNMRRNLADKYAIIYKRFGWCSMQSIFEDRMAAKRVFANLMMKRTQAHLDAWAEKQRELQIKANAQKKLQNDLLNAEQERIQKNHLEKRRQDIVNELAFQRECERMEDKRLEREKQELQKEVVQLAGVLPSSPDRSTVSDLSFASCIEEPDCLAESTSDKDNANTDNSEEEATKQVDATLYVPLEQPGAEGTQNQSNVDVDQPCGKDSLPNVVQYQRSHSDVINSNEHSTTQTEFNRNRQHGLSSDQFQECHATVHLQESHLLKTAASTSAGLHAVLPPDINANLNGPDTKVLTELQRNRKRNEHHDGFVSFNSSEDQHTHRLRSLLNSNTERGRNRLRVMETEFGLGYKNTEMEKKATPCLPLELDKLHVEIPLSVPTPMSTTSDVDFGDPSPRETPEIADTVNNNNVSAISGSLSPELPKPVLAIAKPTSLLPKVDFGMEEEKETEQDRDPLPEACNPFMARRCLQLSVMAPVNAYYVLLRNEVLRIFQEQRIYEHFRKLRNYFFLVDGQFGATLTNEILGRIKAGVGPRSLSQKGILDTMLTNALAACSADETTVSENLTLNCTTIPDTLNFLSVEATSMIKLNCKIDWPLNMVISSETISKYGQIFGYLLKLRHVSFVLDGTYEYLQQMAKLLGPELRTCAHFRHMQMMRHKLSHFMTSFQTHLVAKALLSTWKSFKEELCAANSIEALYKQHVAYLKRVAFLALLNRRSAKVKETIDNILVIILRFCKVIQSQSFIVDQDNYFVHPRFKRLQQEEAEFEKFVQYLIYLGNKAAASGYQEEIGDLICIINFNHYYKVSGNHTGSSMEDKKC
ncbi:uncharacterized protein LOC6622009 [Drosophila sechellia]|uniref:uncharacterized protein LOC6622009 n=1 Tax=Drosophila sechellia TaxID=7238 RepID=UPI0013DE205C|nr:uncharacterized protein LOC6622009 [Drosophila sechellia]